MIIENIIEEKYLVPYFSHIDIFGRIVVSYSHTVKNVSFPEEFNFTDAGGSKN